MATLDEQITQASKTLSKSFGENFKLTGEDAGRYLELENLKMIYQVV